MPVSKSIWFGHLSATEFEEFAFDLLGAMGFVNLTWRKGTPKSASPADSGRDIEGELLKTDVDKTQHLERWFVDCKHYEKGVPATELDNLLSWAQAERPHVALFLLSGFLSNNAKDYLKQYQKNNRPPFKIKVWEQPDLERFLEGKKKLARKYFLLNEFREVKQIVDAASELCDKVWYNRHLCLREKIEAGEESVDEEVWKGALISAEAMRLKYGDASLGPYDDFDWGMINGKLSALRWVLGEDWDELYT